MRWLSRFYHNSAIHPHSNPQWSLVQQTLGKAILFLPNIRERLPMVDSKPKPIEIAELSAHLRVSIRAMNARELEAFTDALAASLLSCNDIAIMARNLTNVKPFESMRGGSNE